ncbi:MAG: hypothetical protein LBD79_10105 [Treponema sp.]|nr:hypothetical protein [Treponema sp.]
MNIKQFFCKLAGYDFDTVYRFSTTATVTGDWLPWFKLDLAGHIVSECETGLVTVDLTAFYTGSSDACGLLLKWPSDEEPTYIELANQYATVEQALDAFDKSLKKQYRHPEVEGFCLLSSTGPWPENAIATVDALSKRGDVSGYYLLGTDNNGNDFIKSNNEIQAADYQLKNYYYLIGISVSQKG